ETFVTLSKEIARQEPKELFSDVNAIKQGFEALTLVELSSKAYLQTEKNSKQIKFHTKPQPSFNKKFDLLTDDLLEHQAEGYTNTIFCASKQQAQRFHDIFDAQESTEEGQLQYKTTVLPMHQGFIDEVGKQVCYTDHQIFERYHRFRLKTGYAKKQAITLKEL